MPKIMAFDISLTSTGWAIWDTESPHEALDVGVIRPRNRGLPRIRTIASESSAVRRRLLGGEGPDLVVAEGYPYFLFASSPGPRRGERERFHRTEHGNGPGNQVFGIAEATGVLKMLWHFKWKTQYALISPTTIKKYASGNGRAKKPEMGEALWEEHQREFGTDDEVDAWYIGQLAVDCYLVCEGFDMKRLPKHRKEAVKTVINANNPEGTFSWATLSAKDTPWAPKKRKKKRK